MLENHIYNLLLQMTEENKSLWRIKKEYLKDAKKCRDCVPYWKKMAEEKERHVAGLKKLIEKHL